MIDGVTYLLLLIFRIVRDKLRQSLVDTPLLQELLELLLDIGTSGLLSELVSKEAQTVEFDEALLSEDSTATPDAGQS